MKKNIKKLFLAAGLLAITGALLTGCGSKKKNAEEESVIKISTAPEPTATPDPKTVDPDAVTSNGNLTMVNEYLAENGSFRLPSHTPYHRHRSNVPVWNPPCKREYQYELHLQP